MADIAKTAISTTASRLEENRKVVARDVTLSGVTSGDTVPATNLGMLKIYEATNAFNTTAGTVVTTCVNPALDKLVIGAGAAGATLKFTVKGVAK